MQEADELDKMIAKMKEALADENERQKVMREKAMIEKQAAMVAALSQSEELAKKAARLYNDIPDKTAAGQMEQLLQALAAGEMSDADLEKQADAIIDLAQAAPTKAPTLPEP